MNKCTKVWFRTEEGADISIAKFKRTSKRSVLPIRSYFCHACGGWHISSSGKYELQKRVEELEDEIQQLKKCQIDKDKAHMALMTDEAIKKLQRTMSEKDRQITELRRSVAEMRDKEIARKYGVGN